MTQETAAEAPVTPRWLSMLVLGVAGLFYAYAVWNAVAYLITLAPGLSPTGWGVLLFAVLFPMLVFVGAYALGRRRNAGQLAVVLLTGLGVVAVFWLNILGYSLVGAATILS